MWTDSAFEHLLSDPYAEHPVVNRHILNGGGKGGGGQQQPTQTTSTVNQSNLPEYARPYYESLLNRAQGVSNDAYTPYGGQRIAQFDNAQNVAFNLGESTTGVWIPNMDRANSFINQSASYDPSQVNNTYQANNYNAGAWIDPGVSQSYMDPYMQNVTDIAKREATRDYDIQQNTRNAQAQAGGAFGGYRHGIVEAEANRNLNQQLQDIQARGLQSAYQTGLGAYNQDRSAAMQSNALNNQFGQQESQLGMSAANANNQAGLAAAQNRLQAGQAQAGLAQMNQGLYQAEINKLLGIGGMRQAQSQQAYDLAYNDFLNQRDYDRQNLNWLSGILRGVPVQANSNVVNYQQPPSQMSQLAGLGLGAAGLYKMMS